MRLDSGRGDLINPREEYKVKQHPEVGLHLTCALHADGVYTWLIGRKRYTDSLIAWKVSDTALGPPVYSKTGSPVDTPDINQARRIHREAHIKMSPNSELLFVPRRSMAFPFHELYRFNRETGAFSKPIYIQDSIPSGPGYYLNGFPDGAFSPDSRKLYICLGTRRIPQVNTPADSSRINLWQFDVSQFDSLAIAQSKRFLGRIKKPKPSPLVGSPSLIPTMQLAVDGKIYLSPGVSGDSSLSIIHCPDNPGPDCRVGWRELKLLDLASYYFPTLNQTFVRNAGLFQVQANKRRICAGDTLHLAAYGAGAERFQWQVSPPLPPSVKVDSLTWQKIPTRAIPPGTYTFTCRSFSRCGDGREKSLAITVLPAPLRPRVQVIQKPVSCRGDSVVLRVENPQSGYRYGWSTGETASAITVRQSGFFALDSVFTPEGCGLKTGDTTAVFIRNTPIPPPPQVLSPRQIERCEGAPPGEFRVLSSGFEVLWNTGSIGETLSVSEPGRYFAVQRSPEGCTSAPGDSLLLGRVALPTLRLVNADPGRCEGNTETREYTLQAREVAFREVRVEGGVLVTEGDSTLTIRWEADPGSPARLTVSIRNRLQCVGQPLVFTPVRDPAECRKKYPLQIPSLVTANGDRQNDRWELGNALYYRPLRLRLFNRWGKTVWSSDDYANDWPDPATETGLYFYRLEGGDASWNGWVEVVR